MSSWLVYVCFASADATPSRLVHSPKCVSNKYIDKVEDIYRMAQTCRPSRRETYDSPWNLCKQLRKLLETFVNIFHGTRAYRMRIIQFIRPKKGSTEVFTVRKIAYFPTYSSPNSISNVKYASRLAAIDKFV